MTATYNGTTAGSTSANPPNLLAQVMSGSVSNSPALTGAKLWHYTSTNYSTDVSNGATAVITDALALGMKAGDLILGVTSTAASTVPFIWMGCVTSVSTSGAVISTNVLSSTHA